MNRSFVWLAVTLSACASPLPGGADPRNPESFPMRDCGDEVLAQTDVSQLWALSQKVPAFAGMFVEGSGTVVLLTHLSAKEQAQPYVPAGATFREARFSWQTLVRVKCQLADALALDGAVFLDADERYNQVVVGASGEDGLRRVQRFIELHADPQEAAVVTPSAPVSAL